jgi:stress-induced-phosphoprotein 1
MKKDLIELQRADQVAGFLAKAQEQVNANDYGSAFKTLDSASRLDAGNPDIERMMSKVRPKFEAEEKARKSKLSPTERFKEQGDEAYKKADFEGAIVHYTACLKALGDGGTRSELALKCYGNRAACYKQISNFDGTIQDCTAVIEVKPDDVKSLVRRAQAFEAVERYKFALQDVKHVLAMPYAEVGEANYQLCNGMQHRLNRVVEQLKNM